MEENTVENHSVEYNFYFIIWADPTLLTGNKDLVDEQEDPIIMGGAGILDEREDTYHLLSIFPLTQEHPSGLKCAKMIIPKGQCIYILPLSVSKKKLRKIMKKYSL